ncbi:uncharacterized protein [Periplaneta americana]|uniref:uncharacterized protein n=1 Tax=Periplaneta americana TaxID=6978 RepID=UPI0037E71D91
MVYTKTTEVSVPEQSNNASSTITIRASTNKKQHGGETSNTLIFAVVAAVIVAIIFLTITIIYFIATRSKLRKLKKRNRLRHDSERSDFYCKKNHQQRYLAIGDSRETLVNRPLPPLPETPSFEPTIGSSPDEDMDGYLLPTPSFWDTSEEIRRLPPVPPIFPSSLAEINLGGPYLQLLPDDASPDSRILNETSENISANQSLDYDVEGYLNPLELRRVPFETRCGVSGSSHEEDIGEHTETVNVSVTTEKVSSAPQDTYSSEEDAAGSTVSLHAEENPIGPQRRYVSRVEIELVGPTQPRRLPPPTTTQTVVVRISTSR